MLSAILPCSPLAVCGLQCSCITQSQNADCKIVLERVSRCQTNNVPVGDPWRDSWQLRGGAVFGIQKRLREMVIRTSWWSCRKWLLASGSTPVTFALSLEVRSLFTGRMGCI